jgi:hypothetical protein
VGAVVVVVLVVVVVGVDELLKWIAATMPAAIMTMSTVT